MTISTYSSVWRPGVSYDIPYMPSMTGACEGPMPSVSPARPIANAAPAMRLACSTGCDVYDWRTAVPSSIDDVARPAAAIAATGSPAIALGYHSELKPSDSAVWACSMNRSMELAPPFNPMRIAATYQPPPRRGRLRRRR